MGDIASPTPRVHTPPRLDGSDVGLAELRTAIDHATAIARHLWSEAHVSSEVADRLVETSRALHRASLAIDLSATVVRRASTAPTQE
jgi:hypothetical protein